MVNHSGKNKVIVKNTVLLYIRMIFLLGINLFTSRIVLSVLGIEDYGIYNVVGGVVAMFSFLNTAMASATQRFLNFDLAKNNIQALNLTFSSAVIIHIIIALIIFLLSETIGLWFLFNKMVIPQDRFMAAFWVFQCSILVMIVNVISVPYNATIIAHEKMSAFAYISIIEATLKLLIVYLLYILPFDKLEIYALFLLIVSICIRFIYTSYSHRHFKETHSRFVWNSKKIKEMGAFASWNLIGNLALVGVTQGLNMLLNVFFGPVVNAARGVAVQVQGAIQQFVTNFQTAVNPQITKSFATKDLQYMHDLVCGSSKFSFFLILFLSLPVLILTNKILDLWLTHTPEYTSLFLKIILINAMIDCLSNPLNNAVNASGIIRTFQLTNGTFMLLVVPLAYLMLIYDRNPALVFISQLIMTLLSHFLKLYFTKKRTGLSIILYAKKVYLPVLWVILTAPIIPYLLYLNITDPTLNLLLTGFACLISVAFFVYTLGLQSKERNKVNNKIKQMYIKCFYKGKLK